MIDWAAWDRRVDAVIEWMQRHPWLTFAALALFVGFAVPAIGPFLH